jgi:hypothetical protein
VQVWIGEQIGPHTWALGATDADWTSIENSVTEPHSCMAPLAYFGIQRSSNIKGGCSILSRRRIVEGLWHANLRELTAGGN